MGSGHFPVAAMEYIARYLVDPGVTSKAEAQGEADLAYWKRRTEFDVEAPGQKLESFAGLDEAAFIEEVRKRRPKSAGKLSPAALRALNPPLYRTATRVTEVESSAMVTNVCLPHPVRRERQPIRCHAS